MKTHFKNLTFVFQAIAIFMFIHNNTYAQQNPFSSKNQSNDNVVMIWNKNTPESEMKQDIKALAEKGVSIKYSNVKRNKNEEITAIKVEYSDRKGNKGTLELENINPIATIKFFKQDDIVGFGEPSTGDSFFENNPFIAGNADVDTLMKRFKFNGNNNGSQSFSFSFPNDGDGSSKSKSQIKIQKDGKKPLIIEDGEVIEGAEDYSAEEIEDIKKNYKFNLSEDFENNNEEKKFDFRNKEGLDDFRKEIEKFKILNIENSGASKEDIEKTKKELQIAKEEMIKAKVELEKARTAIEKSKKI